jgi:hypothetical protein
MTILTGRLDAGGDFFYYYKSLGSKTAVAGRVCVCVQRIKWLSTGTIKVVVRKQASQQATQHPEPV